MANNSNIPVNAELHRLVERYFDGDTTPAEERRMRRLLAESDDMSDDIEAARAVTGIFAAARKIAASQSLPSENSLNTPSSPEASAPSRRSHIWAAISVAASVALLVALVMKLTFSGNMLDKGGEQFAGQPGLPHSDSVAMLASGESRSVASYRGMALSQGNVRHIVDDDDVAALISTEMGYMAEAERSVESSVEADFNSLSGILQ